MFLDRRTPFRDMCVSQEANIQAVVAHTALVQGIFTNITSQPPTLLAEDTEDGYTAISVSQHAELDLIDEPVWAIVQNKYVWRVGLFPDEMTCLAVTFATRACDEWQKICTYASYNHSEVLRKDFDSSELVPASLVPLLSYKDRLELASEEAKLGINELPVNPDEIGLIAMALENVRAIDAG